MRIICFLCLFRFFSQELELFGLMRMGKGRATYRHLKGRRILSPVSQSDPRKVMVLIVRSQMPWVLAMCFTTDLLPT